MDGVTYLAADLTAADGCRAVANTVQNLFDGIDILVSVLLDRARQEAVLHA